MRNLKADSNQHWFQLPLSVGLNEESFPSLLTALAKIHAVPLAMRVKTRAKTVSKVIPDWKDTDIGPDVLAKFLKDG